MGCQKDFPVAAPLDSALTVEVKDVYGFGVTGRAGGIAVYVQRVETVLTLDAVLDFKRQWSDLSYLDRLRNLFTLIVQGGTRVRYGGCAGRCRTSGITLNPCPDACASPVPMQCWREAACGLVACVRF